MPSEPLLLAAELGQLLVARHWQVTTAESCTGGGIAAAITDIAGSSAWFGAGFVTYSNQYKEQLLGVRHQSLVQWGAVSEVVVSEMATGALARAGADIAVAVSGIAGPDGGTPEKPVGTVWLAWANKETVIARRQQFPGVRAEVRNQTIIAALKGLIELCDNTV